MHDNRFTASLGLPLVLTTLSMLTMLAACGGSQPGDEMAVAEGIMTNSGGTQEGASAESGTAGASETTDLTDTTGVTETTGATETAGSTDTESTGPGINFDLAPVPDSPPLDDSCGMVDFLFVIDNSGSMIDEQIALINSFPNFINGIEATLDTVDSIHVGVTTTDNYFHNVGGCQTIGSLVVQTGGFDSSMSICGPYAEGANFMTEMDDLGVVFGCAAQVGTDGSGDEQPMQAIVSAVNGSLAGNGQCNEEFIREDALLVIVLITDEPDITSPGDSLSWYQAVVDAKGGIPENVVVVSLINTPMGICGFDFAFSIADFTAMFGVNGFMADICLLDFASVFDQAVEIIDVACDNFLQN